MSPLFDRHKQGITKSQVGFFDIVGEFLVTNYCTLLHLQSNVFPMAQRPQELKILNPDTRT